MAASSPFAVADDADWCPWCREHCPAQDWAKGSGGDDGGWHAIFSSSLQWIGWALVSVFARDFAYCVAWRVESVAERFRNGVGIRTYEWWRDSRVARTFRYIGRRLSGGRRAIRVLVQGYRRHGFRVAEDGDGNAWVINDGVDGAQWRQVAAAGNPAAGNMVFRTMSQDLLEVPPMGAQELLEGPPAAAQNLLEDPPTAPLDDDNFVSPTSRPDGNDPAPTATSATTE